jgi:hypothetical protein
MSATPVLPLSSSELQALVSAQPSKLSMPQPIPAIVPSIKHSTLEMASVTPIAVSMDVLTVLPMHHNAVLVNSDGYKLITKLPVNLSVPLPTVTSVVSMDYALPALPLSMSPL